MALKYGSKSGGFGLRSGKGVPFKSMGSSPAKGGIMDILGIGGDTKQADKFASQTPKVETTKIDDSKTEKVKPQKIDIVNTGSTVVGEKAHGEKIGETSTSSRPKDNATAEQRMGSDFVTNTKDKKGEIKTKSFKSDASEGIKAPPPKPKKHQAQIRKQKRLDKITARREAKGKEGLSSRQIRLQGEVDKTAEQFVSDRKEKRGKFGDAMIELGNVVGGKGTFSTSRDDKTQDLDNQIKELRIGNYKDGLNETNDISATTNPTTTKDGTAKLDLDNNVTQADLSSQRLAAKDPETATTYDEFLNRSNMSGDANTKKNWSKIQKSKKDKKKYGWVNPGYAYDPNKPEGPGNLK
jgi:hypothetical protein